MNADTLRLSLTVYLVAMSLLALLYLRRRPLTWIQFAAWGLVALLLPALGPFLVIVAQPGNYRKRSDIVRTRRKRDSTTVNRGVFRRKGF